MANPAINNNHPGCHSPKPNPITKYPEMINNQTPAISSSLAAERDAANPKINSPAHQPPSNVPNNI